MGLADYIGRYWAGAEILYGAIIAMTFTSSLREYPVVLEIRRPEHRPSRRSSAASPGASRTGLFYLWERNYIHPAGEPDHRTLAVRRGTEIAVGLIGEQLDNSILRTIPPETAGRSLRTGSPRISPAPRSTARR